MFKKICNDSVSELSDFYYGLDMTKTTSDAYVLNGMTYLESSYTVYDGYLFIINKSNELESVPFDISGNYIPFDALCDAMDKLGLKSIICIPEYNDILTNKDLKKTFSVREAKGYGFEHIYDNFDMCEMAGKTYKNFRNKVHKFRNRYIQDIEIVPYNDTLYDSAMAGYNTWLETLGKKIMDSGTEIWDSTFFSKCLKDYKQLCIDFWLVFDKTIDKCIGCVAYSIINDNLAYGLFRKLSPEYDYISQYMQWFQACKLSEYNIRYMNDAYDGNKDGLRDLKTGFKPVYSMKLYNITMKNKTKKGV